MPQKYCTNCGKTIHKSANYCQFCGAAQQWFEALAQQAIAKQPVLNQATEIHNNHQKATDHDHTRNHDSGEPKNTEKKQKTIEKQRLCQRAVWSFYLSYIAKTSLLFFLFVVGVVFEPLLFGLLLGAYLIILYLIAITVHQNYYYEVNTSAFRKEYGVVHKTDVTIPFNRIQNVNITRSLSDRVLGLARVDIESAGSSSTTSRSVGGGSSTKSEGHLPGVTIPQAKAIHDLLIEKFGDFQQYPGSANSGNP